MGELIEFLSDKMSMTEVYQPAVIRALLENDGVCSKEKLAGRLAEYDASVQSYYEGILMRWPKTTLTKHGIVEYDSEYKRFILVMHPKQPRERQAAIGLGCCCWARLGKPNAHGGYPDDVRLQVPSMQS